MTKKLLGTGIFSRKHCLVFALFLLAGFALEAQQKKLPKIEEITGNVYHSWVPLMEDKNHLWGVGVGELSTLNASCEMAKVNAQADICRQIITIVKVVSSDNPLADLYKNEFYAILSYNAAILAAFELSEFITTEKRAKDTDGNIWYLVSLKKSDAVRLEEKITRFVTGYFNDYQDIERMEDEIKQRLQ